MKCAAFIVLAVALQASVHARPEPLEPFDSIWKLLGGSQAQVEAAVVPVIQSVVSSSQQQVITDLFNAFKGMVPFNLGRASSGNAMTGFLLAYLNNIKQSDAIRDDPKTQSLLDAVSNVVSDIPSTMDPISGMVAQTNEISNQILGAVAETMPNMFSFIGNMLFQSQVQTRGAADILGDISGILNMAVETVKHVLGSVASIPGAVSGDVFGAINGVIANITHIKTTKGGLDGGFDIMEQAIGSLSCTVEEMMKLVHKIADPVIKVFSKDFETALLKVNDEIARNVNKSLSSLANGTMSKCAAPITQSMRNVSLGLNEAVTLCLNKEVNTMLTPLNQTLVALNTTSTTIARANAVLNYCLSWNVWECAWNIAPCVQSLTTMSVNFATIPLAMSTTFNPVAIQTRLPTCIAQKAATIIGSSALTAATLMNCMK